MSRKHAVKYARQQVERPRPLDPQATVDGESPESAGPQGGQGPGQGRGANPGQARRDDPPNPAGQRPRHDPADPAASDPYRAARGTGGKAQDARSKLADVGEADEQRE